MPDIQPSPEIRESLLRARISDDDPLYALIQEQRAVLREEFSAHEKRLADKYTLLETVSGRVIMAYIGGAIGIGLIIGKLFL